MNKDVYSPDIGGGHNVSRVAGVYAHLLKDDDIKFGLRHQSVQTLDEGLKGD